MKSIIKFLITGILIPIYSYAQGLSLEGIEESIKASLLLETGNNYLVYVFDVEHEKLNSYGYIFDNSGQLDDCYIFLTLDPANSTNLLFGIYKGSNIIWKTSPIVNSKDIFSNDVFKVIDLNKDGNIEVIISMFHSMRQNKMSLWIFSWDGNEGTIINQYDNLYNSTLTSLRDMVEIVDYNGDGWKELYAEKMNGDKVIYTWQSGIIGDFNVAPPLFLPRDKVEEDLNIRINKRLSELEFIYNIVNKGDSKQSIERITIKCEIDTVVASSIPKNWQFFNIESDNLIEWSADELKDYLTAFIGPGETENDFRIIGKYLPRIARYYIQGNNGQINNDIDEIFQNSVSQITIAPKDPPSPFIPEDFIDTLLNYNDRSYELEWIKDQATHDKYAGYLNTIKTSIYDDQLGNARSTIEKLLQQVDIDSSSTLTSEAYALLRYNSEYLLEQLPEVSTTDLVVDLKDSQGNTLTGGLLKYYEGGWKDAVDNGDGTFTVDTDLSQVSLRMNFEYASQTVSNIAAHNNTYSFQTVNTQVELRNSQNNLITDESSVKYYSGGWRDFGVTSNGIATKELLPNNYSFRMSYAYASNDKKQDIGSDPVITFNTVNTQVELKDSQNNLITDEAIVKYYSGGWRDFGVTSNGIVNKELLPNNYSFRMVYGYASNDRKQDIGTDPVVTFKTVNTQVELRDSQNNFISEESSVKYYSGGWRDFGITSNGIITKELLPNNYSFRMTYAFASNDKKQDVGTDPVVTFKTVNTQVELRDSQNNMITDEATAKYYSGGWRDFGVTSNGIITNELLPNNYSFRISHAFASNDKKQDISIDPNVVFQTVNAQVELRDSQNNLITEESQVKYYSGGWRDFGETSNGIIAKELLPSNYSFRMTYAYASNDKKQDISENPIVVFQTINTQLELRDSQNSLIAEEANVKYYSGGWREFGIISNGIVSKELLPNNYSFRMTYAFASNDKKQDISIDPNVVFQTVNAQVELQNSQNNLIADEANVKYYSGGWRDFGVTTDGFVTRELLPNEYSFRIVHEFISNDKKQDVGENPMVSFATVLCNVSVTNLTGSRLDGAIIKYYSGGWRNFGETANGVVSKELLPTSLTFRANYESVQTDKKQDIGLDNNVELILETTD